MGARVARPARPLSAPCPACGARVPSAARFCAACGEDLARLRANARREVELVSDGRVARAVAVVFLGALAILSSGVFVPETAHRQMAEPLFGVVAFAAALCLGRGALSASFGRGTGAAGIGLGIAAGAAGYAASYAFLAVLRGAVGATAEPLVQGSVPLLFGELVLLPALFEEWLCRGVLWVALRRALGVRATVVVSAVLFAFLHGLGGGGYFEFPHRFAFGVLLGMLRARTGSLVPCVLAHATHNALVLLLS